MDICSRQIYNKKMHLKLKSNKDKHFQCAKEHTTPSIIEVATTIFKTKTNIKDKVKKENEIRSYADAPARTKRGALDEAPVCANKRS